MTLILDKLDIYGIDPAIEDCIFASLLQGDPALLIGPPGCAKTELLEMIAVCLREHSKEKHPETPDKWFSYQFYDTSKLNPEDLIGFPDPRALSEGKVDYINLPSNIWKKDMVVWDEINRCEKSRQANLFEILRSRRLTGMPTGNKFLFSAMNPYGDHGTEEMSDALVDRHMFYLWFDGFHTMTNDEKIKLVKEIEAVNNDN